MIISKEELINGIKKITADKTDELTLKFLEDFVDTLNNYEAAEVKWRTKYKERFLDEIERQFNEDKNENENENEIITTENIFKEVE